MGTQLRKSPRKVWDFGRTEQAEAWRGSGRQPGLGVAHQSDVVSLSILNPGTLSQPGHRRLLTAITHTS